MIINGRTRVYALIGDPVAHSLSPRLCNAAFELLGEDAAYVALPSRAEEPAALVAGLDALGLAGVNVTYPLKAAVLPHLASASALARRVGAVNVLARDHDGRWRGENTDAPGLILALATWASWTPAGRHAAILGGGAAARAAAAGLIDAKIAGVTLLVRDVRRAARAVGDLGDLVAVAALGSGPAAAALAAADLVVQATPVGLDDAGAAVLATPHAAPGAVGFELNYGAAPTAFVRAWRAAGRVCLDGRDLLTAQAHLALRLWLGRAPELDAMRRTLDQPDPSRVTS